MSIRLLCLALWALIHPAAPRLPDAASIAAAIDAAISADAAPPVFGSREEDAAVMAYYALRESWLTHDAVGDGGRSWGVWQQSAAAGRSSVPSQARAWLVALHAGARVCPQHPAAPLSGGCACARGMSDRRVAKARKLLAQVRLGLAESQAP